MNERILAELPKQFDQLAVRVAQSEGVQADLTALVTWAQEAAGADAGWQQHVKKFCSQIRLKHEQLSVPEPALPGKLDDLHNQRRRTFYEDPITRLDAVTGK